MLKFTMPKKLPPHRPKAFVHGSDMIVPTAERDVKLVIDLANAEARIAELEAENVKLIQAKNNGSRYLVLIHENETLKDQVADLEALRDKLLARIANLESSIRGLGVA